MSKRSSLFEISTNRFSLEQLKQFSNSGELKMDRRYYKLRKQFSVNSRPWAERIEYFEYINSGEVGCSVCDLTHKLQRHHVVPLSRGGDNRPENIILICEECHKAIHGFEFKRRVLSQKKKRRKKKRRPIEIKDSQAKCVHGRVAMWCVDCRYWKF